LHWLIAYKIIGSILDKNDPALKTHPDLYCAIGLDSIIQK